MTTLENVLHVEDSSADAVLVARALRAEWPDVIVSLVADGNDFDEALGDGSFDAVLLDLKVPNFDLLTAINKVRGCGFDGPVFVVSGTIGTQDAVAFMRAGANDFIEKDALARLVPALTRELKDMRDRAARREAETALDESTNRLSSIFRSARDAFVVANEQSEIIEINPAAEEMFGFRRVEVLGNDVAETIIPPQLQNAHNQAFANFIKTGRQTISHNLVGTEARRSDGTSLPVELSISTASEGGQKIFTAIIRDVSDRVAAEKALSESDRKTRDALVATVDVLSRTIERRDPYTAGHQKRVAELCVAMARELNLDEESIFGIQMGALIHDVGKIHIPGEILTRPGRFSDEEYSLIKTHASVGYDIIKDINLPWPLADMVRHHHEKIDGSGYPDGLKGEQISIGARLIAVADIVEAITMHRPYRPALGTDAALEEITKLKGRALDPDCVEACTTLFREKEFEFSDVVFE